MYKIYDINSSKRGTFIDRPNRFIANILIDGSIQECHVHDSGRMKELLFEGNSIGVKKANPNDKKRRTNWSVISAFTQDKSEDILINSGYHRYLSEAILSTPEISPIKDINSLKAEVKYGDSRLDYLAMVGDTKVWIEVKGISLVENKIAKFPDAPSTRAQKHLKELIKLKKQGDRSAVLFLVLREAQCFRPKYETDINFSKLFYEAINSGVEIYFAQLFLKNGEIFYIPKTIDILKESYYEL